MSEQNKTPKVSIIIPCHNAEKLLHNSLDSVLAQTYRCVQAVVIDDGSTDGTAAMIEQYKERFVEAGMELLFFQKENGGAASAVNIGLKNYDGDYVMWLDCDDILCSNSLEKMVTFLQNNPHCDYCMGQGLVVAAEDTSTAIGKIARIPPANETKEIMMQELLLGTNTVFGPGTVMCKRELMELAIPRNGIYESRQGQNWQMMIPLTYYGSRGYIHEPLFLYVKHEDSHNHKKRDTMAKIAREREFSCLCTGAIQEIEAMPIDEKEKWTAFIKNSHLKTMYDYALLGGKYKEAKKIGRELQKMGCRSIRYRNALAGITIYVTKKIWTKLKKIKKRCFG